MKNPRPQMSRLLAYNGMQGWEQVTLFDIYETLELYRDNELPKTFIGKVRLAVSLMRSWDTQIGLKRYFETLNCKQTELIEDQEKQNG